MLHSAIYPSCLLDIICAGELYIMELWCRAHLNGLHCSTPVGGTSPGSWIPRPDASIRLAASPEFFSILNDVCKS